LLVPIASRAQTCNQLKAEVANLEQGLANDQRALANCRNSPGTCSPGQIQSFENAISIGDSEITAALAQERTVCAHPPPPPVDHVILQGMEVTQTIQDMNNSVSLFAGKATWVRVYFDKINGTRAITANLVATRSGGPTTTVSPSASVTVDASESLKTRRQNFSKSLNFLLPASVTNGGTVSFALTSPVNAGPGNPSIICGSCSNPTQVQFLKQPALIVRAIGISYRFGLPALRQSAAPTATDFALLRSWLGRAYPVGSVTYSQTTVASTNTFPFTCTQANAQLASIRANDISSGTDSHTHYLGLVSNKGGFMRGCSSGIPASADPSTVASAPTGPTSGANEPVNVTGDSDGSFGDWYGGHELAHTFGRAHPGFCNNNTKDDTSFPYPNGQIGTDVDVGYAGLDIGDSANSIPRTVLWPSSTFDIMTYCNQPQWLSAYTYEAVRQRLLDENPGFVTLARLQLVNNRSDILSGAMVHVAATVNLTSGTGKIALVSPVQRAATQLGVTNRAALVVRDSEGRQLTITPVALREATDIPPGEDQTALVDAAVPFSPAMAQIDLMLDGKVLDQFRGTVTAPSQPRSARSEVAAEGGRNLIWEPSYSAAGTRITYTVQISNDGNSWSTIAVGLTEPTLTLTPEQAQARMARIVASSGFSSATPIVIKFAH
jgi:hypothetical protein